MEYLIESLEEIKDLDVKGKIKPFKNYILFTQNERDKLAQIGVMFTNSVLILNEAKKSGLKHKLIKYIEQELVMAFDIMQARPDIAIHMTGNPIAPIESN